LTLMKNSNSASNFVYIFPPEDLGGSRRWYLFPIFPTLK